MNTPTLRDDARVIGLVSLAHGVSHFYHLVLAALFPWLKPAFDLSYAQLGLLMTLFFVVSGIGQALSGFVVDKVGARRVLFSGLALLGTAALVLAGAQSYLMLAAGSMLAGLGNAVFHPADYTLLNQRVSKARIAHAFSLHGISGNLGWAAAPAFLAGIAALAGWRIALLSAAAIPFATLALLFAQRAHLRADPAPVQAAGTVQDSSFAFMKLPAVWMSFGFFFLTAIALGGIQSFSSASLVALYGISLASATTAYTAYMLASAAGMVLGGFLATRAKRHDRTIALSFICAALMALLVGAAVVPGWMAVVLMGGIGLAAGVAGPSRDLLIRAAAPKNATGRVFGIVYSGLDSGLALGPLLFGTMMDRGHPGWVFGCIALFQVLAIGTALTVGGSSRAPALKQA
ncbi:MFS transporter [Massilia sp. CCM 8733]|uniref:MFS transporter n=1 Tax=Massilia mucilaginosa TaxID=2609282 RepID=A0ABX0NQ80_9BURK|nr:MFS transporter [Massilia mucilaginosa]NHZ88931.1 MFS transporter [Massilia mucilaginosa]